MRSHRPRWVNALLLGAMALCVAGCVLLSHPEPKEKPLAFSHAVHAAEEIECADCHAGAEDSDEPGMPAKAQCMLCHSGIDEAKPPEKRIDVLFVDGKLQAARVSHLGDEVIFSHARHVASGTTCETCHAGITKNERIEPDMRITMDACTQCHAGTKTANECATCHREIRKETPPQSHAHQWTRMHGQAVRWPTGDMAGRCDLCHTESTCTTCHMEQAPRSHDNFWRIKGHGVAASMDRAGCATCHREDTCIRCHSETMPLNHTGSFGAPRDTHCLGCHFPLADNSCAVCHKGTPSHLTATPMPAWHDPGMNCRQCHGVTQSLPHVDNGSTCIMCHR